jgi:transcriptional regulator
MLGAIVGLEMRVTQLSGKWKVSQNRPAEDRAGVADALVREGIPGGAPMAALVREAAQRR